MSREKPRIRRLKAPARSKRVRRLSDGRIFSCAEGAAYSLGDHHATMLIANCCMGFLPEAAGSRWEFVEDYIDEVPIIHVTRNVGRRIRKGKADDKDRRKRLLILGSLIQDWVGSNVSSAKEFRTSSQLFKELSEFDEKRLIVRNSNDLSKHISWWSDLYREVLGIKFGKAFIPEWKKYARTIAFFLEEVSGLVSFSDEIYEVYVDDSKKNDRIPNHPGRKSHPIHYINEDVTFASIRSASRAIGVPYLMIKYCCEGDISKVEYGKRIYRFEYGDPDKVIFSQDDIDRWSKKPRKTLAVICTTTGEEFKSLKEASLLTGISQMKIKRCCEGAVIRSSLNRVQDYGRDGVLVEFGKSLKFEYLEVYYGNVNSWKDLK